MGPQKRLAELQQKYAGRPQRTKAAAGESPVQMLPQWSDEVRGAPNVALRSALFSATMKHSHQFLERQSIHAQKGYSIFYSGPKLDQMDLDVWESVLHIAREKPLGHKFDVTAYRLLKLLNNSDSGKNRDTLNRHLSRLKATALEIRVGHRAYMGSLIDDVERNEVTRHYVIRLNPGLQILFESDQFTLLDWSVRLQLRGKPLSQWLHGYYSSHAAPFPVAITTLYKLCGSQAAEVSKFTQTLKAALAQLAAIYKANGQKFQYEVLNGCVHVSKTPSGSQRRHLDRRQGDRSSTVPLGIHAVPGGGLSRSSR